MLGAKDSARRREGAFVLVEDQFGLGDIVDVGEASGTVEPVSLRTTRLRAIDGTVWHVPNGGVLEEPELWGAEQLGANGVMLRLVVKTTPSQQWRVSRELRERIKVAFEEEGIAIPFPQQTVWHKTAELSQS